MHLDLASENCLLPAGGALFLNQLHFLDSKLLVLKAERSGSCARVKMSLNEKMKKSVGKPCKAHCSRSDSSVRAAEKIMRESDEGESNMSKATASSVVILALDM